MKYRFAAVRTVVRAVFAVCDTGCACLVAIRATNQLSRSREEFGLFAEKGIRTKRSRGGSCES